MGWGAIDQPVLLAGPCPKTVILSAAKDLPLVAYLGETLRQAQGDTLGPTFEAKLNQGERGSPGIEYGVTGYLGE